MNHSAGDVDYSTQGRGYARKRQTDPRIAARVHDALGEARTVLNIGAGAGSYEPIDRYVLPIEPSETMRSQRPSHLAPAVDVIAEHLPLDEQSVDASIRWSPFQADFAIERNCPFCHTLIRVQALSESAWATECDCGRCNDRLKGL